MAVLSNGNRTALVAAVVTAALFTGLVAVMVHAQQGLRTEHLPALSVFFLFVAGCAFAVGLNLQRLVDHRRR